ncbi:hypothetical protein [Pseudomonas sp.]|jgi:hypothetical protein|uniref:hypothetical protein n=1 Tax=Pseudomonas sp. TaxID=306 RepID=UPI0031B571D2
MKYIEFVKVDAGDGLPETQFPLRNGPADPFPGITIAWWTIDEVGVPHYFGTAPDKVSADASGVLRVIEPNEWDNLVVLRRSAAQEAIDTTAGKVRVQFVSAGELIELEYQLAAKEVAAWRAAGSDPEAVPVAIQSGADYSQITVEEAAAEIEQTANAWNSVLLQIRAVRLNGKRAIRECTDQLVSSVAQSYIDQLNSIANTPVQAVE